MKPRQSAPLGTTASGGARNWQTSKGGNYVRNFDSIFSRRTNRPGFTITVYRNGKKQEFADAELLSPAQVGLRMKVTGIV